MPQFFYKAKNSPSAVAVTGYIEAENVTQVVSKLIEAGQTPLEITLQGPSAETRSPLRIKEVKISAVALIQFTRHMADLLGAGIPLLRCMDIYSRQKQFPAMAKIAGSMVTALQKGASLSVALSQNPSVFLPLYVNAVKAGEATGQLPLVLARLVQLLEQEQRIRKQAQASLLYPLIILGVGLMTIFVLLSFVLPRLTLMFEDFDTELPWPTQVVVGISQIFAQYWWVFLIVAAAMLLGAQYYLSTPEGKIWRDTTVLRIPVLKSFIENTQLTRLGRTLGMLLESGVPVAAALELSVMVVDNVVLQKEVKLVSFRVKEGMGLAQAVRSSGFFPEVAVDLIAVGQESGRLEKGLYKLADGCDQAAQSFAQTFITILGPAVLVLVVGIVGAMIVAILLPLFQINSIIR